MTAQQSQRAFLLEITNNRYIPKLNKDTNLYFVDSELSQSKEINDLLSALEIDNLVYVNDIDVNETKNLIFISVLQTDANLVISSLNKLINDYIYFTSYEEVETYEPLTNPYIPIDYENAVSFMVYDQGQYDLNMIRATEAWGITRGDPNVLIGISDTGFWAGHPDLDGEIVNGIGNYDLGPLANSTQSAQKHGSAVAGKASAATDNEVGSISAIGFDTKILAARGLSVYNLKLLSLLGAKVVNASFGGDVSESYLISNGVNTNVEEMIDNGTVVVAAAGNGIHSGGNSNINGIYTNESYASRYYAPASYKNVISVSTVGDKNDIGTTALPYDYWKDVHLLNRDYLWNEGYFNGTTIPFNEPQFSWQHNDSVDIVVPAYYGSPRIFPNNNLPNEPIDFYRGGNPGGTSYSAPIVAGTIGLMFSVNFCLDPKEVETILKLTAVKIDDIPENLPFYGRLGAGRLDAYEAVKMSKDMAEPMGTVEVRDRVLYRPWFYKLITAPYEIKMTNNNVSAGSKVKFRARNNIEILSGDYSPGSGGYVDLQIDANLSLNRCPPPVSQTASKQSKKNLGGKNNFNIKISPTLVTNKLNVEDFSKKKKSLINHVRIFNIFGILVFEIESNKSNELIMDLSNLSSGIYIVKVFDGFDEVLEVQKVIKK